TTDGKHYYLVSAHTSNPNVFYDSNVDSGYSVDNLAPLAPGNFITTIVADTERLSWSPNTEPDLKGYVIYRGPSPLELNKYATTNEVSFTITNPLPDTTYWAVRAKDIHENLSPFSQILRTIRFPLLVLYKDSLSFGEVAKGDSLEQTFCVRNNSISPLIISSVSISTSAFITNVITPDTLSGYETLYVKVKFKPITFGEFRDTLKITSNGGSGSVILIGSSSFPTISVSPTSAQFGDVPIGDTAHQQLVVKNTSINELIIDSVYTRTRWFSLNVVSGRVRNTDSLTVQLAFTPDTVRGYTDTLFLRNNSQMAVIKIVMVGNGTLTGVDPENNLIPKTFALEQNYPNPFNPSCVIQYALPERSQVILKVYNLLGQEIAALVNEDQPAGYYYKQFDANGFPSGIYIYRIVTSSGFSEMKKMLLIR
ncbi:MAG: choice-of-anchor D domain-containing protein, partial [Bacteroidota bacterium]|nr:choice-of-anchor D domain-containing protein [Bacteroidota bacterium]